MNSRSTGANDLRTQFKREVKVCLKCMNQFEYMADIQKKFYGNYDFKLSIVNYL